MKVFRSLLHRTWCFMQMLIVKKGSVNKMTFKLNDKVKFDGLYGKVSYVNCDRMVVRLDNGQEFNLYSDGRMVKGQTNSMLVLVEAAVIARKGWLNVYPKDIKLILGHDPKRKAWPNQSKALDIADDNCVATIEVSY